MLILDVSPLVTYNNPGYFPGFWDRDSLRNLPAKLPLHRFFTIRIYRVTMFKLCGLGVSSMAYTVCHCLY